MATYKSNNSNISPSWSYSDQQQSQVGSTLSGYSKLFGIAGVLYAAGHIPIRNKKLFDYYSQGLRYFEEYTPGRIGRTLQLSTFMSPFESSSRAYKFFSPSNIREFHPNQLAQLQELGINIYGTELRDKGFRYEKGKFLLGQSDSKVLLEHASIYHSPMGATPHFQEGYIRSLFGSKSDTAFLSQSGKDTLRSSLITKTPYTTATGETASEMMMFAGGKTRLQSAGRFLGGVGTSWIERYNRLLTGVSELLPENKIVKQVGNLLSVKSGPGLQTLGKLSLKLGVGIPAALMAYDLLDWGVRKFPLFNGTILDEGITAAGLSLYQKTQIGISKGADLLGLHSLREAQENAAPGSTSLLKLSAFPITGAIAAATYGYTRRAVKMAAFQKGGFSLSDASLMASAEKYVMEKQLYGTALPEELTRIMPADLIGMVEGQTANTLQGLRGRFAKRIVEQQGKKGLLGSLLNKLGKVSPGKINTVIGAGIGLGLILPFLPGALIPSDRPEKLERIYSSEELVPIRKGRWWELNSSPYEGGRILMHVPHWTVRHMTQARDIAIYGGDYPEIYDWFTRNFTYDIERENYYSRPYAESTPAFSEVPIIGPILGATLGRIIKPPRMMHTEETDVFGPNGEVVDSPLRYGQTPMIPEAGEMASDKPISPYGITPVVSDMAYNLRELIGLPGWLLSVVNNEATGSQGLFDQATRYQTAGDIYSTRREYWEQEYGSLLGISEIYRRLYPKKQGYEEWNAIPNAFSNVSWLPGAGEKSENFTVGDPYTKVPLGEFRLPGPAFEELHPELKGLSPNEYPLRYQLQILGDVAPYSDKYRMVKSQVSAAIKRNELSDYEIAKVGETLKQVEEKKQRKVFTDSPPSRAQVQQQLADINNAQQQTPSEPSWLGSVLGGYWNALSHNIETPLEQLTPISPGAKFVHMRTATEDYAKEQLYGTSFANWATPMKSFINPFLAGTAHAMGSENVPPDVQQRRDIESYFDAMQYLKYTAMKRSAQEQGDTASVAAFEQARRKTMVGANYYSPNPTNIMKALPHSERDYFTAFSNTTDPIEQQKILSMVPDTSKAMYQARWDLRNATQQQKANKADNVSNNIVAQQVSLLQRDEGFTRTSDLESEYNSSKIASESFPDWYRRTKLIPQVIRNRKLPGPDWVGWNPITMMDDVKLKVVENLGESPFQYDIWQEQQRAARRKQYLDTAAQQLNYENLPQVSTGELQNGITQLLTNHDIYNPRVQVMQLASASKNSVNMEITQDREKEIKEIIRKRGLL